MVKKIRTIPYPQDGERISTGAVKIGNDWPGLFWIRILPITPVNLSNTHITYILGLEYLITIG